MANGEIADNPPPPIRQLLHDDVVLRILLKRIWLDDLHEAFMLRKDETDIGLSVCFDCTPGECVAFSGVNRSYGVASLVVGDVIALNLTVVPDDPHHANIKGIPHKDDNSAEAERLASRLAIIATIVDRTKRQN